MKTGEVPLAQALAAEIRRLALKTQNVEAHLLAVVAGKPLGAAAIQDVQALDEVYQVLTQLEGLFTEWDQRAPLADETEASLRALITLPSLKDRLSQADGPMRSLPPHGAVDFF